nr:hypothetical protein Itr_chr13CG03550 [Ipomoea trifida]GMD77405.1 hypothetical protein Iba_chr13cCG3010 [Ipomoea batatas]
MALAQGTRLLSSQGLVEYEGTVVLLGREEKLAKARREPTEFFTVTSLCSRPHTGILIWIFQNIALRTTGNGGLADPRATGIHILVPPLFFDLAVFFYFFYSNPRIIRTSWHQITSHVEKRTTLYQRDRFSFPREDIWADAGLENGLYKRENLRPGDGRGS